MEKQDALKFNLYSGKQDGDNLVEGQRVGYSLLIEGNQYYLLKLFLFEKYFFLVKNKNSSNRYTIYGSKFPNEAIFKNPIGWAEIPADNSSYIHLFVPPLGSPIYMNLFPV